MAAIKAISVSGGRAGQAVTGRPQRRNRLAIKAQRNANLKQLLGTFSAQVNSILANQQ